MNRYEREIKAIEQKMLEEAKAIEDLYALEDKEDRSLEQSERDEIVKHGKALETLRKEKEGAEENLATIKDVKRIGDSLGPAVSPTLGPDGGGVPFVHSVTAGTPRAKSLGEMFVEHDAVKAIAQKFKGGVREQFNTGAIELNMKGTVLEGSGSPGSGTGGGLIPIPQVIPGVVEKLFQPLSIADLLLSGQANSNSVRYVVEGTATSGAAGVAEGGAKPQSSLALSTKDMPVTKIATSLKVSDEMLEDVAQVQSYINGRLTLFVDIEEERELVGGAGSNSNELQGIIGTSGVNVYARGTVDTNAVALFKAMNGQRGSAFLEPDWIAINPANWQTIRLATDTAGQFFGGGPFLGQYGAGANLPASGQVSGAQDQIWNKPVVVTTAVGAGTALVGTRAAAQVWTRGGLNVSATNANEDDFLHNLVAIRAEKREALTVFRPAAYTVVSGLN